MIIVGELINASRKAIREALEKKDRAAIEQVARDQAAKGAHYIDVNAGVFVDEEVELLTWLVEVVQGVVEAPCCLDSPNPQAIEAALKVHRGTAMINSISLESQRCEALLPLLAGTDLKVVALCMSDKGMPETTEQRLAIAEELVGLLTGKGVPLGNIYVDPLVQPVSANQSFGISFLNAVDAIHKRYPEAHFMCGLSNVSYGLPARSVLNRFFMAMAIAKGLDGAIVNPLDDNMMAAIYSAEALAGRDNYCLNYIKAFRAKRLGV
ncbi:MAG: methyltetrahydrofolate cobalamin methyltransferase [Thermodesulfobacteriota bacterium]